ncbi:hypothetical protein CC80DRAFT_546692 [Byssothecium circinans]|uniref:Uncharacterized protein n=1 Tax=Byssothecium circinans TaxID=147558 RepID=A0A6A5U2E1_9PLEO|nr:hypothetical protein CC80DRAFT_546692 [Byssothecium circinans]
MAGFSDLSPSQVEKQAYDQGGDNGSNEYGSYRYDRDCHLRHNIGGVVANEAEALQPTPFNPHEQEDVPVEVVSIGAVELVDERSSSVEDHDPCEEEIDAETPDVVKIVDVEMTEEDIVELINKEKVAFKKGALRG